MRTSASAQVPQDKLRPISSGSISTWISLVGGIVKELPVLCVKVPAKNRSWIRPSVPRSRHRPLPQKRSAVRQLTSIPISVTSALAYPCEALTDDVDTPFRATDVAGKKMLKVRILE